MFGLFKKNESSECPVDEEARLWIEESMVWLLNEFGLDQVKNIKVLTPEFHDMPVDFNGSEQSATAVMNIIARQMDIDPDQVHLEFYDETSDVTNMGGFAYRDHAIELRLEELNEGQYWGKDENGKYNIGIRRKALKASIDLIATLAHEMAHIKLLGESRIEEDNQPLVDLATVIFGMGIFNSNASLQIYDSRRRSYWQKLGYLSSMEWAYALALFSYIRQDEDTPAWARYLSVGVKADLEQGLRYIDENETEVLKGMA